MIYALEPFCDNQDGLLKVKGRLDRATIVVTAKNPTIVPRDHHVTELLIQHIYERDWYHSGREYVMPAVRQLFWIPKVPFGKDVSVDVIKGQWRSKERRTFLSIESTVKTHLSRTLEWTF